MNKEKKIEWKLSFLRKAAKLYNTYFGPGGVISCYIVGPCFSALRANGGAAADLSSGSNCGGSDGGGGDFR